MAALESSSRDIWEETTCAPNINLSIHKTSRGIFQEWPLGRYWHCATSRSSCLCLCSFPVCHPAAKGGRKIAAAAPEIKDRGSAENYALTRRPVVQPPGGERKGTNTERAQLPIGPGSPNTNTQAPRGTKWHQMAPNGTKWHQTAPSRIFPAGFLVFLSVDDQDHTRRAARQGPGSLPASRFSR